jgi:hypothetical protein
MHRAYPRCGFITSLQFCFFESGRGAFVMRTVYEHRRAEATEIERTLMHGTARLCSSPFGRVCKALWPFKTAEELAARVGCSVRAAAYEISGEREPGARSVAVIVNEITKRQ